MPPCLRGEFAGGPRLCLRNRAWRSDTMIKSHGYAARDKSTPLAPFSFERRDVGPKDVQIDILYCGVCHSDLHRVYNDWNDTVYPVVPGHEIIGRVTEIGTEVAKYKKGDIVGVGVIIDSCQNCDACNEGLEN